MVKIFSMNICSFIRKFVIVENILLVCLLDLTAEFGVKTNAKLTLSAAREEQNMYSELSGHS